MITVDHLRENNIISKGIEWTDVAKFWELKKLRKFGFVQVQDIFAISTKKKINENIEKCPEAISVGVALLM